MSAQITGNWNAYQHFRLPVKKTTKLYLTAFVRRIHRWKVDSPHQRQVMCKTCPCHDFIVHQPWQHLYHFRTKFEIFFLPERWYIRSDVALWTALIHTMVWCHQAFWWQSSMTLSGIIRPWCLDQCVVCQVRMHYYYIIIIHQLIIKEISWNGDAAMCSDGQYASWS